MLNSRKKTIFFSKVVFIFIFMFTIVASSVYAEASPTLNASRKCGSTYYLWGGILESTRDTGITAMTAYYELYKDGAYLGSKQADATAPDLVQSLKTVAANITDCTHSSLGTYSMTWSTRTKYASKSDVVHSGKTNFTKTY